MTTETIAIEPAAPNVRSEIQSQAQGSQQIPLADYLQALLPETSPYWILNPRQALLVQGCFPSDSMTSYVLENNPETRGMNGLVLPMLGIGEYRLWHKKDWDLADNRRLQILRNMDRLQAERANKLVTMRDIVKRNLMQQGITDTIADMMMKDLATDILQSMYDKMTATN